MGSQFSASTRKHDRDPLVARLPHGGSIVRHDQTTFTFRASFDAHRIQQALQKVVRRYAVLRTGFTNGLASASQSFMQTEVTATAELVDLRQSRDDAQREDRLSAYLQDDAAQPFDLEKPPLLRLVVFRWQSHSDTDLAESDPSESDPPESDQETLRILLTTPAGLLDDTSKCLLIDEWLAMYAQISDAAGLETEVDCPQGLANVFQHQETDALRNFWKTQLAGYTSPVLIDAPLPVEHKANSGVLVQCERYLEPNEIKAIRNSHKQDNVSLEILADLAVACLLSRYTNNMHPVFGAGLAGRSGRFEDRVGFAGPLHTHLPMRIDLSLDMKVSELLAETHSKHQALRNIENCSSHCVAEAIDWPLDQPLFGMTIETLVTDPLQELAKVGVLHGASNFHVKTGPLQAFAIQVIDGTQPLLRLTFDSSVCTESFAGQLLEHLAVLITNLAMYPDRALGDVPMLTGAEQLPIARSRETLPAPGTATATINERFAEQLARSPQAIAVADGHGETSLSYAELDEQANAVAERLLAAGVKKGEFVGLCVERETRLVAGILGILKSGAAYLPLDPSYPVKRLQFMIEDAGARLVVVPEALRERLPEGDYECIDLPNARSLEMAKAPELPDPVTRTDPAYVLYTSGSTGQPKGVIVSHGNVTRLFDACQDWLQAGPDDVWTFFHSYAFDVSVWEMWGALFHGGRLEVVSYEQSRSPDQFWNMLKERNVTVLSQTPSAFQLLDHEDARHTERLSNLRKIVFGGEALEFARLAGWISRYGDQKPELINMYGITETTVHATYYRVSAADLNAGNGSVIGHPLPDLYFYLLDDEGRPVPAGAPGEIWVGGAGVAQGYLNRPELNAQRFQLDPHAREEGARLYRSGDYARLLENGELAYLGRRDNEVKIRGFRIDIGEISGTLRRMPGVLDTAVIAQPGPNGMKRLIAYVVTSRKEPVSEASIRSYLAATLPAHMIPAMVIQVPKIPLTANGKADVKALPLPESESVPGSGSGPSDKIEVPAACSRNEAILMRIWREVLVRKSVKADDDFFALGGDSILALDVATRARQMGLDFSPAMLLSHPRLNDLATRVRQRNSGDESSTSSSTVYRHPITATQRWLLQHVPWNSNPDELNRVQQFSIATDIDDDHLEQAWLKVIDSNKRLRTRYEQLPDGDWSALESNTADAIEYSRVDLDHLERSIQDEAIHIITEELRHSLSIQSGLLVRVARFQCGGMDSTEAESDRLVVVLHQLAVDPQAWSNILVQVENTWQRLAGTEQRLLHAMDLPLALRTDDFPFAGLDQHELDQFPLDLDRIDDILPLSPIQQLYYSVANTHSDVGFDSQVFELEGDIDPQLFKAAWQRLVMRHDVLRTVFVDEGLDRPRQAVLRHIAMNVDVIDWSELAESGQQEQIKIFCEEERNKGFDLCNGPLLRLTLARTQDRRWIFILSCHRLQVDGWSMPILFDELGNIYDALQAGIRPELPHTGSYRNFIAWLEMRNVHEYEAFWKEQLRGLDRGHLLTGNGGTMVGSGAGNSERSRHFIRSDVCLPKDLTSAIDKFSRENRMTPSVLFQGAWSLLLAALTGSFDVTFGAAYSGRTAGIPESENTVGPFINDIPVRVHVHPTQSIADWIVAIRNQQSGLTEFQNASPAEIHQWAQRSHAYRLFDTLLVFQNFAVGESGKHWGKHIKVRSIDSAVRTNYPVSVTVTPGVHYTISLCVDDEVLSRESTEAISLNFIAMLNSIIMDADIRVGALLERTPRLPRSPTTHSPTTHLSTTQSESAKEQFKHSSDTASIRKSASRIATDDTMDRIVEEIVCDVLELDTINRRKNFFDLGAQSVSLLEIHRRLQDCINRHFPIIALFQYPTPSALAGFLRAADGNGESKGQSRNKDRNNSGQPGIDTDRARMMRRSRRSPPARPPVRPSGP
jgi:amino acid adenylation domain-containing protein